MYIFQRKTGHISRTVKVMAKVIINRNRDCTRIGCSASSLATVELSCF